VSVLTLELLPPHPSARDYTFTAFPITVGRDSDCELPVDPAGDQSTSWHHVRIEVHGAGYIAVDCNTTNGTLVNGQPITTAKLRDGDRLQLGSGGPTIRVSLRAEAPSYDDTAKVSVVGQPVPRLLVSLVEGAAPWPQGAREFSQPVITLGREADNDIGFSRPPHPVVSRYHAEIALRGGQYRVLDKDATNGTFINRQRIHQATIKSGDLLMLGQGGPVLAVHLPGRAGPSGRVRRSARAVVVLLVLLLGIIGASYAFRDHGPATPAGSLDTLSETQFIEARVKEFARAMNDEIESVPPSMVRQIQIETTDLARSEKVTLEVQLSKAQELLPEVTRILRSHGLPEQLAYIAFQESRFDPEARSRAGAVGLWQLMASTARDHGLRVDKQTDERTDAVKSTHAAARYLKKLYLMYGDFMLTLAAYNYGPANVNRALTGLLDKEPLKNRNYWYLVKLNLLPRETDEYVYKVIAGWIVATHPERFGLKPEPRADRMQTG
jgi:pSer/pThr/pTyr-binding forkhead associated (FHA) protein